jgi:hypothetical protein
MALSVSNVVVDIRLEEEVEDVEKPRREEVEDEKLGLGGWRVSAKEERELLKWERKERGLGGEEALAERVWE